MGSEPSAYKTNKQSTAQAFTPVLLLLWLARCFILEMGTMKNVPGKNREGFAQLQHYCI
jgi:hypothetical protein